jgi:hypothetical protein
VAFGADHADGLDRLDEELRLAQAPMPELFRKVIADACTRIPVLSKAGKAARIDRLIAAGAWTDAAFALIALEIPAWKVRRLVCENGEWFCSLSRQPNLPAALDDTADANHELMPVAILLAFLQARRTAATNLQALSAVPHVRPALDAIICCDNFA